MCHGETPSIILLAASFLIASLREMKTHSALHLFRVPARVIRDLTCHMESILYRKNHCLGMQIRPGGSNFTICKEMTIRTNSCLCIRGGCPCIWQAERDNRAGRVRVSSALLCDGQTNLLPGRRAGRDHVSCTPHQKGQQQGVKCAPASESLPVHENLVRPGWHMNIPVRTNNETGWLEKRLHLCGRRLQCSCQLLRCDRSRTSQEQKPNQGEKLLQLVAGCGVGVGG